MTGQVNVLLVICMGAPVKSNAGVLKTVRNIHLNLAPLCPEGRCSLLMGPPIVKPK